MRIFVKSIQIIIKFFSPTDAQFDSFKNNFSFVLRLSNCVSVGEITLINNKVHGMFVKTIQINQI